MDQAELFSAPLFGDSVPSPDLRALAGGGRAFDGVVVDSADNVCNIGESVKAVEFPCKSMDKTAYRMGGAEYYTPILYAER